MLLLLVLFVFVFDEDDKDDEAVVDIGREVVVEWDDSIDDDVDVVGDIGSALIIGSGGLSVNLILGAVADEGDTIGEGEEYGWWW